MGKHVTRTALGVIPPRKPLLCKGYNNSNQLVSNDMPLPAETEAATTNTEIGIIISPVTYGRLAIIKLTSAADMQISESWALMFKITFLATRVIAHADLTRSIQLAMVSQYFLSGISHPLGFVIHVCRAG
ncbi:hypothetical protein BaRGS_00004141 [Batillaria attramentaria]|uniref:Uncharacterized protein n=1 Tax=Batillaria attramentaria TaxID=370345 RepID=A0ABD0LYP2_9CAEN